MATWLEINQRVSARLSSLVCSCTPHTCTCILLFHMHTRRGNEERVVPFRESKLTRLFQNYFVGKGKGVRQGKITMFVNISNAASVFDETIHVLKFSALTSKVCLRETSR